MPPHYPTPIDNDAEVRRRNKHVVRRGLAAINRGEETVEALQLAPDFVDHSPPPFTPGADLRERAQADFRGAPEALADLRGGAHEAFRDAHYREEVIVAEGDMVFLGWEMTGTHSGPLYDREPTGIRHTVHGGEVFRLRDGKIVERWDQFTRPRLESLVKLGVLDDRMLEQLGNAGLL